MRTLMTLLTLGAGGAGYFYLQQVPAVGEPYSSPSGSVRLVDWQSTVTSKVGQLQVPLRDLVGRIHAQTRSVLDEFASQHGGHSDAPVDDAFERLRQVTQSAVVAASNVYETPGGDAAAGKKAARGALLDLSELQRTAFDPSATEETPSDATNPSVVESDRGVTTSEFNPGVKPLSIQATAQEPEPMPLPTQPRLVETGEAPAANPPISNVSQSNPQTPPNRAVAKAATKRDAKDVVVGEWKVVGKTTEGRPMHSMHLGDGGTRTLVIAGLNGKDSTAVRWLELLADELKRHPEFLKTNEVVLFRAGNPDGLVKHVRDNARGVPLNRNFPGRRYRPTSDMPQFAVPAGEVETRVMLDTLYHFRPRRVIHLSTTTGRSQVVFNRSAKTLASELERSAKLPIQPLDPEQCPGSLEDFADGTLEAAVLSTRLSVDGDWQQAWTKLQPHLVGAVIGQPIEVVRGEVTQPADPDRSPIPVSNIESVSRTPRRRGYEELPAPPQ